MWILCTVTDNIAGKKRWGGVTRADALNRSFTVFVLNAMIKNPLENSWIGTLIWNITKIESSVYCAKADIP